VEPGTGLIVTDDDPSHHVGRLPGAALRIEKATNGEDADTPTGPIVPVGEPVTFTYAISNTGGTPLANVVVRDDSGTPGEPGDDFMPVFLGGDADADRLLDLDETWTYSAQRVVPAGQYANLGVVTAEDPATGQVVADDDPSHHFGRLPGAAISIEKATDGEDADTPTGSIRPVGDTVTFTYEIRNTGSAALAGVLVLDDNGTPGDLGDDFMPVFVGGDADADRLLDLDETWTYTAERVVTAGQYANLGVVTAVDPSTGQVVADDDPSHHVGRAFPAIDVEKFVKAFVPGHPIEGRMTGGGSVFTADGVRVTHGFELHCNIDIGPNNLEINFAGNQFHLEQLTSATCLETDLDQSPGPLKNAPFDTYIGAGIGRFNGVSGYTVAFTFTDAGEPGTSDFAEIRITAPSGQTVLLVSGTLGLGNHQTHRENKKLEGGGSVVMGPDDFGADADLPPGPIIAVGQRVDFTYVVTNPGQTPLADVVLIDDNGTPGDPADDFRPGPMLEGGFNIGDTDRDQRLDAGETWLYEASTIVTPGPYRNVGTVTGTPVDDTGTPTGDPDVTDADPGHLFGAAPAIRVEKAINALDPRQPTAAEDADQAPGPVLAVGSGATWTYQVFTEGNIALSIGELRDDAGTPGDASDDFAPRSVGGDADGDGLLDPGEVWLYTSVGEVDYQVGAGPYANIARVTAVEPHTDQVVIDQDPSHHFGALPGAVIQIEKAVNATDPRHPTSLEDADVPTGPQLVMGTMATWTYLVSNPGSAVLAVDSIRDDFGTPNDTSDDFSPAPVLSGGFNVGDADADGLLDLGEVWQYTSAGVPGGAYQVVLGQYTNVAMVTARDPDDGFAIAVDPGHHVGQAHGEGVTPGFWKNNALQHEASAWPRDGSGQLIYQPAQPLESAFDVPDSLGLDAVSLQDGLDLGGGGAHALLRHAVAALLNATQTSVAYPLTARQVIDLVNAALASGEAGQISNAHNQLDGFNNLGADLDQHGDGTGGHHAPTAANDSVATGHGTPTVIAILANDADIDGNALTVSQLTQPTFGTVVLHPDDTIEYHPRPGFTGTDSVTYRASDGWLDSNLATVTIQVAPPPPVTTTHASDAGPTSIPDQGTLLSTLVITDAVTILDLNVRLTIAHQRAADLDVFLRGPGGIVVELFTDVGGNGSVNFQNALLDDDAAIAITAGSTPFAGTYRPEGDLRRFEGQSLAGTWTLEVRDDQNGKIGTLNGWSLIVDHVAGSTGQHLLAAMTEDADATAPAGLATPPAAPKAAASVRPADLPSLLAEAVRRLSLTDIAALSGITVQIADLPGRELGAYRDGVVYLDVDAAGHGWFVDRTPRDDREFAVDAGALMATRSRAAQGMDLLSVIAHELGHAAGLDHADTGAMVETLREGERTVAPAGSGRHIAADAARGVWPAFALTQGAAARRLTEAGRPAPVIDWTGGPLDDAAAGMASGPGSPLKWVWDPGDQGAREGSLLSILGRRWAWKTLLK
jgi:subtilisin-like proprotein convertase family protein